MLKNKLTQAPDKIRAQIREILSEVAVDGYLTADFGDQRASIVLLLLGLGPLGTPYADRVCVVLTKRSAKVRQPGDLCCPGGGINPRTDAWLSGLIRGIAGLTVGFRKESFWPAQSMASTDDFRRMYATGIREAYEEIRLNPWRVRPLGLLPAQRLVMYGRTIHPVVGWIKGRQALRPNWEVARVQFLPLDELLDDCRYVRLQFEAEAGPGGVPAPALNQSFPCYVANDGGREEMLWGATFRIVLDFLALVFDFEEPDFEKKRLVNRTMPANYLNP